MEIPFTDLVLFFGLSQALYDGCLDQRRGQQCSDEELITRGQRSVHLHLPDVALSDQRLAQEAVECYRYLYERTWAFLETAQDPSLFALADALVPLSETQGRVLAAETARRLLAEGAMRTWLHPLLFLPASAINALAIGLSLFFRCYAPLLSLTEAGMMNAVAQEVFVHMEQMGLLTGIEQADRERFLTAFQAGFVLFGELFVRHPDLLHALGALFAAETENQSGLTYALGWLLNALRQRGHGSARHALFLLTPFFPPEEMENCTLRIGGATQCLFCSCQRAVQAVATLRVPLTGHTLAVPLLACEDHRHPALALLKEEVVRVHLGWQVAQHAGLPTAGVPQVLSSRRQPQPPPLPRLQPRALQIQQVLERFRQRSRPAPDNPWLEALARLGGEKARWFGLAFGESFVDLARKYELAHSALAVAAALPAPPLSVARVQAMAFAPAVWILFEETLVPTPIGPIKGLSFGHVDPQNLRYAQQQVPLSARQLAAASTLLHPPGVLRLGLHAFDETGQGVWVASWLHEPGQPERWVLPAGREGCAPGCGEEQPCASCLATLTHLFGLYANCLRLITGELAAREEPEPRETRELHVIRKERDPGKPHKFRQRCVTYPLEIVTFNAARSQRRRERQGRETGSGTRGSWIVDPETIVWVSYQFAASKRRLKDPRYRKYILSRGGDPSDPAGYEIEVRAFDRRVPITFETLRRRLQRVTYEPAQLPPDGSATPS